jgi:hypothetical protein
MMSLNNYDLQLIEKQILFLLKYKSTTFKQLVRKLKISELIILYVLDKLVNELKVIKQDKYYIIIPQPTKAMIIKMYVDICFKQK